MAVITNVAEFSGLAFEQITMTGTAGTLASFLSQGIPNTANHMMIYSETNDLRWRADGTDPTLTVGMVISADEQWIFESQPTIFATMKIIGANTTKVNVHFFI